MINPYIVTIEGDLSRADVVVLIQLCRGKDVVEYGAGGSTLLLSQVASSVLSFETKDVWIDRTKESLAKIPDKTCDPRIVLIKEAHDGGPVEGLSESCDVLFVDGWAAMRHHFLMEFWMDVQECAIVHDTRATYGPNVLKKFIDAYDPNADKAKYAWGCNPYLASLKTIEWNYLESNMAVFHKRNCELYHEDWKKTEAITPREGYGTA